MAEVMFTLLVLVMLQQIVLGFDSLLYISLNNQERIRKARIAIVLRIILLFIMNIVQGPYQKIINKRN